MSEDALKLATSVITVIPSMLAAYAAYLAYLTGKDNREALRKTNTRMEIAVDKIEEVRHATNSMKDELVRATAMAAHSEGMAQGVAQQIAAADSQSIARAEGRAEGAATIASPAEPLKPPPDAVP